LHAILRLLVVSIFYCLFCFLHEEIILISVVNPLWNFCALALLLHNQKKVVDEKRKKLLDQKKEKEKRDALEAEQITKFFNDMAAWSKKFKGRKPSDSGRDLLRELWTKKVFLSSLFQKRQKYKQK